MSSEPALRPRKASQPTTCCIASNAVCQASTKKYAFYIIYSQQKTNFIK